MKSECMFAVIRIRGKIGIKKEIEDTLRMLRLNSVNNCVVVPENPSFKGMIEKVKDYVTYGEIDKETLIAMLKKRLRLEGNRRLDEKNLKEIIGVDSFEVLAEKIIKGELKLKDLESVKPVFRLTPPSKGFKSVKEHYPKGDLGYRGKEINELLKRMI